MPFRSSNNDDPAFDEGLAEAVAAKLTEITAAQSVQIVSPREIKAERVEDIADAHKKMGVNLAIAANLQRIKGATRVSLELVDAATRRLLRAETLEASVSDAFTLQDQVIATADFAWRNGIDIGSADHEYAQFFATASLFLPSLVRCQTQVKWN